jgi:hypothetical protein
LAEFPTGEDARRYTWDEVMKRSKAKPKTRRQGKRRTPARRTGSRNIDVATVRQQIINIIGTEAATMVWAAIEEGHKGHYQAMKYLFEVAGIFPVPANEEKSGEAKSYAEILCKQLGLQEEPLVEEEITDVAIADEEHAVESGSGL